MRVRIALRDSSTQSVVRVSSFMDSRLSVKYGQKVKVHGGRYISLR